MPALVLFAFGLALQLVFLLAGPDGGPGWHVGFQGDAPVWQRAVRFAPVVAAIDDARSRIRQGNAPDWPNTATRLAPTGDPLWREVAQHVSPGDPRVEHPLAPLLATGNAQAWRRLVDHGVDDELRLPWRPPAMVWFVSMLWNGDPARVLPVRLVFAVVGAASAPLLWLLVRRHTHPGVAVAAAGLVAVSANVLLLGSGLHTESLYLALLLAGLIDQRNLDAPKPWFAAIRFGLLHAFLCLLRAEHALTAVALLAVAAWLRTPWRVLLLALATNALVLLPWQLHANRAVADYNAGWQPVVLPPPALPWDADAMARVRTLPAFAQLPTFGFVTDTMRARGASKVTVADLDVVREAYGCFPEPLRSGFLAMYGPLNFFLANSREADGGFARAALDRTPPLTGGDTRYPPGLRRVLPTGGSLVFGYPPHLDAVVNGAANGLAELRAEPGAALARIGKKLWHALQGATPTVGGTALPIGLSGERRQVDLVTASGTWANVWRVVVCGLGLAGLWCLRRTHALWPLFAFGATKVAVVVVYFGYARQGALCLPLVALGLAGFVHAVAPRALAAVCRPRVACLLLAALLAFDTFAIRGRTATLDARPVANGEPFGAADFTSRRLEFR
ncbi:MAG: hypothetical protein JNK15_06385 [Planctomycetes bacterium]|nr:hypothetical protein [Planctomycetota bacterium]